MGSTGARLLGFGDSFIANGSAADSGGGYPFTSTIGILPMLEAMSLGRLRYDHANNKGVAGQTSTQVLARYGTDVTANLSRFDVLYVAAGRNDPDATLADGNTTVANLSAICTMARAQRKVVLLEIPNPPRSFAIVTDAQRRVRAYVNEKMRAYARATQGVTFCDYYRDWVDASLSTGAPASGISSDGLHPDITGALYAARRLVDQVGFAFPYPARSQAQGDWYDATTNTAGNILAAISNTAQLLQGTAGTASAPVTGNVATSWTCSRYSGTGTEVVCSKDAASSGYDSVGGDKQVITISTLSGSFLGAFRNANITPAAALIGQYVEGQIELDLSALVGCTGMALYLYHWNGTASKYAIALNNGSGGVIAYPNGRYLFRTPPMLLEPSASQLRIELTFQFNAGGSGVIKASAPSIRVVDA